jgi:hypothetical protein
MQGNAASLEDRLAGFYKIEHEIALQPYNHNPRYLLHNLKILIYMTSSNPVPFFSK